MENKNILMIPIWLLYTVDSIEEVKFDSVLVNNMKEYGLKDRKYLYSVINSVDRDFDFHDMIKGLPNQGELSFSNDKVFEHLINFKKFMENFGLIEDDN